MKYILHKPKTPNTNFIFEYFFDDGLHAPRSAKLVHEIKTDNQETIREIEEVVSKVDFKSKEKVLKLLKKLEQNL